MRERPSDFQSQRSPAFAVSNPAWLFRKSGGVGVSPSVFAGGHSGEFSEIRVEIAAVAVAHGFTDLPRRHFWLFTEHRTGIAQAQLVPPRAEVHSILAFHKGAHRRCVGVESFEYVFVGNVLLPMFSLGLPLPKPLTKSIQFLLRN